MSNVFYRQTSAKPPVAVRGEGVRIYDSAGRDYIDACCGAAVTCLGHNHPRVIRAVQEQVAKVGYVHSSFFTTEAAERLAAHLIEHAPSGMSRAYFTSSGSESGDVALKTARQYHIESGQPERSVFIGRLQSYHGNTLGALAVGDTRVRREPFAPMLMPVAHISACYPYRHRRDDETEEQYGLRAADELEQEIQRIGPGRVAAFIVEPVVGSTIGAVAAVPGYLARIREICDRHGVLLIFDEVMCGMGRTGTLHACEHDGVTPDIMMLAKGLGAGYQPIGAVLVSEKVYAAFEQGGGTFLSGQTYNGHPVACAAALATQQAIQEEGLLPRVRALGELMSNELTERFGNHRHIGDVRGRGLFQAIELVADRSAKAPFDVSLALGARIRREAMARGLLVYAGSGTADGRAGDHILLAPPFVSTDDDIHEIVNRLGEAVDTAIASTRAQ